MITALYLTTILFVVQQANGYQIACPNNQRPKTDGNGNPIQCLPGASQRSDCGMDHVCFFSGMNYMCCPSNEPSPENQPTCPEPAMTVLDAHGLAMKCSARTRICPGENMYCSDVGLAFICCEKAPEPPKTERVAAKKSKRRKTKTTTPTPESLLECPTASIGVLDYTGNPRYCNSQIKCPGYAQFCHGGLKKSICCEKYMFAENMLDTTPVATTIRSLESRRALESFEESQAPQRPRTISIAMKSSARRNSLQQVPFDGSTAPIGTYAERTALTRDPQERLHNGSFENRELSQVGLIKKKKKKTTTTTTTEVPTTTTSEPTTVILEVVDDESDPIIVFTTSTTEEPTTTPRMKASRRRMQGIKTHGIPNADNFQPIKSGETSLLRTREDKRAFAQEILMDKIRNGWPYDDRFYRPDVDQEREPQVPLDRPNIAQLRFLQN